MVNPEGGYATKLSRSRLELFAWNFTLGPRESDVDPHDYWVQVYRFEAGRFLFSRRYIGEKE